MDRSQKDSEVVEKAPKIGQSKVLKGLAWVVFFMVLAAVISQCTSSMVSSYKNRESTRVSQKATVTVSESVRIALEITRNSLIRVINDPTTSIESLSGIYAAYMRDGSLDGLIIDGMIKRNATSDQFLEMENLKKDCSFSRLPPNTKVLGALVMEATISAGEWSGFAVGRENEWRSCWIGTRKFDRRIDMDDNQIDLYGSSGMKKSKYVDYIEYRISEKDPDPDKEYIVWLRKIVVR